jgi:hypothetical protein
MIPQSVKVRNAQWVLAFNSHYVGSFIEPILKMLPWPVLRTAFNSRNQPIDAKLPVSSIQKGYIRLMLF